MVAVHTDTSSVRVWRLVTFVFERLRLLLLLLLLLLHVNFTRIYEQFLCRSCLYPTRR